MPTPVTQANELAYVQYVAASAARESCDAPRAIELWHDACLLALALACADPDPSLQSAVQRAERRLAAWPSDGDDARRMLARTYRELARALRRADAARA